MTLPIVLVIDDIYARKELAKQSFLTMTNTIEISLEDSEQGNLPDLPFENKPIAYVVFNSGQIDKDGYTFNNYELIKSTIKRNTRYPWSLILLDVMFDSGKIVDGTPQGGQPGDNEFGLKVRHHLLQDFPGLNIVMLTSKPQQELGSTNENVPYLTKPRVEDKTYLIPTLVRYGDLDSTQISNLLGLENIVATSAASVNLFRKAFDVAQSKSGVLLLGESGVGKEVLANYIHNMSSRKDRHLISVNCGAIPESLIESELFGHERGAFTGAIGQYIGKIQRADLSTLFLDEIGELPLNLQVKLLRFLQEGTIERVGGRETIPVDVRIISATNRNLYERVREGKFREDLYYRLKVVEINIPPLRDRREDICPLAKSILNKQLQDQHKFGITFAANVLEYMESLEWPGNVRELKNVIEMLVVFKGNNAVITKDNIPDHYKYKLEINRNADTTTITSSDSPADVARIRSLERQIAELNAKLSKSHNFEDLPMILEDIDIPTDIKILTGALKRLNESYTTLTRKMIGAALLVKGRKHEPAIQMLMNDDNLEGSQIARFINKIIGGKLFAIKKEDGDNITGKRVSDEIKDKLIAESTHKRNEI